MVSSEIKHVTLCGASGYVGIAVLKALAESGRFRVTVLTRTSPDSNQRTDVTYRTVNYDSHDVLVEALQGQDAVVSTIGKGDTGSVQKKLIDAATAAGVKHFIPSEFGGDLQNPTVAALPIYRSKVELERYLEQAAATNRIAYTFIHNNILMEFGIRVGSIVDVRTRTVRLFDGGAHRFSSARVTTVAQAVVSVLANPGPFKNRAVRVRDVSVSQQHILDIARKLTPGETWNGVRVDTAEEVEAVQPDIQKGIFNARVFSAYANRGAFAPEFGCEYKTVDNDALGIAEMSETELERYIGQWIKDAPGPD